MLTLLAHFYKNFVRENFLERKVDFNCILTKKPVFDKKVAKTSFTTQFHVLHLTALTGRRTHFSSF
nr:MAG TPA: hypothetical protein [Caudoviricetes sp.]